MSKVANNQIKMQVENLVLNDLTNVNAFPTANYILFWDQVLGEWTAVPKHGYTYEGTVTSYTPNFLNNVYFQYWLDRDATVQAPTNSKLGDCGTIAIKQTDTGSPSDLIWDPVYIFPEGIPVLSDVQGEMDVFEYKVVETDRIVMKHWITVPAP